MPRRASVLALLVALLALSAAGCGDSGARDDYVRSVNDAQNRLARRFSDLQAQIRPTSTPQQDRRTLAAYEEAVRRAVTDLRGVDPPSGFGELHRRFIGDIADYGTEVRRARGALDSGRPKQVMAAQQRLVTAVGRISARINATIAAINRKLKD